MIFKFNCCCDGKCIYWDNVKRKFVNQDGEDMINKENHPFLIISKEELIKGDKYITVIPITSSSSNYNEKHSMKIGKEMVDSKAQTLVNNNSYFKVSHLTRIFKTHLTLDSSNNYTYCGSMNDLAIPSVVSEVMKTLGK